MQEPVQSEMKTDLGFGFGFGLEGLGVYSPSRKTLNELCILLSKSSQTIVTSPGLTPNELQTELLKREYMGNFIGVYKLLGLLKGILEV